MLEDEKYLESLVHAGRSGPDTEQVERLEQRLDPWFRSAQEARAGTSRLHVFGARASKVLAAVIGIGLLSAAIETRVATTEQDEVQPIVRPVEAVSLPMRVPVSAEPLPSVPQPKTSAVAVTGTIRAAARQQTEPAPSLPMKAPTPAPVPTPEVVASENASEALPPIAVPDVAPAAPMERAPSGESEVAYLRRAQAALSSNPQRALSLADEHPSRFPSAVLVQEREVIAIDALVKLRRVAEARARVAAFRVRYPSSAHLAHVVSAVGETR